MIRKYFKKVLALCFISTFLFAGTGTNAAAVDGQWVKDNMGWYYAIGNSYATGWKNIDGNWYYFYSDGYMAYDTVIDGYYLNNKGAWTNNAYNYGSIVTISGTLKAYGWQHLNQELYPGTLTYYVLEPDIPATFTNVNLLGEYKSFNDVTEIELFELPSYLTDKVNQHVTITGEVGCTAGTQYYHRTINLRNCN